MQTLLLQRNRGFQTALIAGGVLVVSMVLSIFAMKMLSGQPSQRRAPAPAVPAAAKKAAQPKKAATFKPKPVQTRKVARTVHAQLPYASGAEFMQAAEKIAKRKWGAGVLHGSRVSVSMLCASGYSVVIWRNQVKLASVSLYLRRTGAGWDAVSGIYSRFTSTGAVGATHRFGLGSAPVGVDCFDPM